MENQLVSIIMPTFNCAKFIEESIKSVQYQTYSNWELIIIDDFSTDNTFEVISRLLKQEPRIIYIKLNENSGAAIARNKGIECAKGSYIAFLDSDDLWKSEKLQKQLSFMMQNDYNVTCTSYNQITESGKFIKRVDTVDQINYDRVLYDCPIGNSTVIINIDKIGKIYVPNIRKRNDDALWLKILKSEKFIYGLNIDLMDYRIRTNSLSRNKIHLIKYHWQLYREIEKLSTIKSTYHILIWIYLKLFKVK